MKRLLVRMSALAVVLVLGFFAIAQAQRRLQGAGEQVAQGADSVTPQTDTARAQTADPSAAPGAPRSLPSIAGANPLRRGQGPLGVNPVRATATTADDPASGPATARRFDGRPEPASPKPADPLGLSISGRPVDATQASPSTDPTGPAGQAATVPDRAADLPDRVPTAAPLTSPGGSRTADPPNAFRQKGLADYGWPSAAAADGNRSPLREPQGKGDTDAGPRQPATGTVPREIVGQRNTAEPGLLRQGQSPAGDAAAPRAEWSAIERASAFGTRPTYRRRPTRLGSGKGRENPAAGTWKARRSRR